MPSAPCHREGRTSRLPLHDGKGIIYLFQGKRDLNVASGAVSMQVAGFGVPLVLQRGNRGVSERAVAGAGGRRWRHQPPAPWS